MTDFLRNMIAIPALSGREAERADFVERYLVEQGLQPQRMGDNIIARVRAREAARTVMLCSHLDTVPAAAGYTFDPHQPPPHPTMIRGLGSNDAGASVACMVAAAMHFHRHGGLPFDLLLMLAACEENSGEQGIASVLPHAGPIDCAIVGEPTGMRAAVAERGLLVLDATAHGVSGHAARDEGDNAIYHAIKDIDTLRRHRFARVSATMGNVRLSVTQIEAGTRHNVVPDRCRFVVDIRPTDVYTNAEIVAELQPLVSSVLTPRSLANRSSATPQGHELLTCAQRLGIETFVSPTTSDWMRLGLIPAIKMGPGDSARSHAPDEWVGLDELEAGRAGYINFLEELEINHE